jgi:transposase
MEMFELTPSPGPRRGKRVPVDPAPRFLVDVEAQSDVVWGNLEAQVEDGHLARAVWGVVKDFDVSMAEAKYSALGRRGYPPRRLLALWIYASLVGEHHASKVAVRIKTDAALRWIAGGRCPSVGTLRRFRRDGGQVFDAALTITIQRALELDLIDARDLATDSVRLRAHASSAAVRTRERSTARLKELSASPPSTEDEEATAAHASKVQKHEAALARCEKDQRTNFVETNELAGLIKFANGSSAPGHRVTVTAAGASTRIVLSMLLDADATDSGKLVASLQAARDALIAAGSSAPFLQAAADAGYFSQRDLVAATQARDWLDVIVAPKTTDARAPGKYFGRDRFEIPLDAPPRCPAGREMTGPHVRKDDGAHEWSGVGCATCPLRPDCTPSKRVRRLTVLREIEEMRRRFADPLVKERYNRRIATIEPVFSSLVDAMRFKRASSRHALTIRAELLLKLLAHNVSRLLAARRLRLVHLVVDVF